MLDLQRRLWSRLQEEIEASIVENPPNVDIYKEEYRRDVRGYQAVSSKRELVEAAAAARLVYVGDYHTLPQAQRTVVKLLLALTKLERRVVLCMELVHSKDQELLDRYMLGELSDEAFLKAIDYERTWGFEWAPYAEIFALARRRGLRVVGINSDPQEHEYDHLLERDFRTAKIVAREAEADPDAIVLVFDGDLHVARDHLPFIVANYMEYELGVAPPRHLIVHQNAEEIYWKLAGEAKEREVNVVRLADDAFCVINASPLEKLHSYLNWVSERDALESPSLSGSSWDLVEDESEEVEFGEDGPDYTEQVHRLVCTVAEFLQIERDDLDAFTVFTVNDLDFLDYLAGGDFSAQEVEDIKRQILSNESYFIPKGDIIYLADFSLQNAAEEATHFLHHRCSGYGWEAPRPLAVDFYFRVVTEAIGYFGSKVIVPTRECWREADCQAFVEANARHLKGGAFRLTETGSLMAGGEERVRLLLSHRLTLKASRLVLEHKRAERHYLRSGRWPGGGAALAQPTEVHLLVTHMLGHMLGDKLYYGLLQGALQKRDLREVFAADLEAEGEALARYLALIERTQGVAHGPTRAERL